MTPGLYLSTLDRKQVLRVRRYNSDEMVSNEPSGQQRNRHGNWKTRRHLIIAHHN